MDEDITEWQRAGSLFGSYDDPSKPGDRLCVETHNVYHHDRMVQVGPFFVHKDIHESYFYPPQPEDYMNREPRLGPWKILLMILGFILVGIGIGFVIPLSL